MNTTYQTLIVKFSEPITALDGIFDDTGAWGTDTLKGWIDNYESTRFTATDSHTAVITSEYNMECVKEWLQRQTLPSASVLAFILNICPNAGLEYAQVLCPYCSVGIGIWWYSVISSMSSSNMSITSSNS